MASLALLASPTQEPLGLDEVKAQIALAQTIADFDVQLQALIVSARQRVEAITNRQLISASWALRLDHWPGDPFRIERFLWASHAIELPKPPLQAIESITYLDMSGATVTWDPSNYVVDLPVGPTGGRGRVSLAYTKYWPITLPQANAITVTFTAGYGDEPDDVPADLRHAMRMLVADLFADREGATASAARFTDLILPYVSRSETRQLG